MTSAKLFPTFGRDCNVAGVVFEEIEKRFPEQARSPQKGEVVVLNGINLEIADGEFMVVVGPSGCGKSTLLRLLAGLETPSRGLIKVGDRRVDRLPAKARDIAMVFQSYALYPHLSVYDNLAFGLRRQGDRPWWQQQLALATRSLPKSLQYEPEQEARIKRRVREVATMLQLDALLDRQPKQLSGGQKQRVALGRAIARNPQVFLMDEPLSNLDAKLRAETRAQIVSLQRQLGVTTLYVTHDQTEAMTMGDRIAVLNRGHLQQVASPLDIYERPANRFVAQFIGSPPMNLIPVTVRAPLQLTTENFRCTLPEAWEPVLRLYDGQTVELGIRPEHLEVGAAASKNLLITVTGVEALGSDTFIAGELKESGVAVQARLAPQQRWQMGDSLWLTFKPDQVHLFDLETGKAIRPS